MRMQRRQPLLHNLRVSLLFVFAIVALRTPVVHAGGIVGTGTPDSCTEAALDAALAGGGIVTFNCGSSAKTITVTGTKTISANTTIDGSGLITISGGNVVRVFAVNAGVALNLQNLTVANGRSTLGDIRNNGTLNISNSTITGNAGERDSVAQPWAVRYAGTKETTQEGRAVALDSTGNIYVGGRDDLDYVPIKYDPAGRQVWIKHFPGFDDGGQGTPGIDIGIDSDDNIYMTTATTPSGRSGLSDWTIIKCDSNGNQLWATTYDRSGLNDWPSALAIDASNNVYVTGWVGDQGRYNYGTIKIDSAGVILWASVYAGGTDSWGDEARALAIDATGNVYITGQSPGTNGKNDIATVKYDRDGMQLWVARYNGPADDDDSGSAIALDTLGSIYVTGHSVGNGTADDFTTIKYSSTGQELWTARYNGPANSGDGAYAIAIDSSDNIYVTGASWGGDYPQGTQWDYATVKYDSYGNELWVRRYNGPTGNWGEWANKVKVDHSDNVFVTGGGWGVDYATIKYDSNGNELWVMRYDGTGSNSDIAYDMAISKQGDIYVTGISWGLDESFDIATVKYMTNFKIYLPLILR